MPGHGEPVGEVAAEAIEARSEQGGVGDGGKPEDGVLRRAVRLDQARRDRAGPRVRSAGGEQRLERARANATSALATASHGLSVRSATWLTAAPKPRFSS